MLRISSALAVGLALACAFILYIVSYDTRELDHAVQSQERRIERLRSDIPVLKAERAYLSRPARIEPLARAMGLAPARGEQYIELDSLAAGSSSQDGAQRSTQHSSRAASGRPESQ